MVARRARAARPARHRARPRGARRRPARRRAAARRDRQGAVARRAHPHHGRADLGAVAGANASGSSASSRSSPPTASRIVYISHRIDEVMRLADRVTVLRDGRHVLTAPIARARPRPDHRRHGRPRQPRRATARGAAEPAPCVLSVRGLSLDVPAGAAGGACSTASASTCTRRDPRHRRPARLRPHGDPRGDLRRDARAARRRHRARRPAGRHRLAARRAPARPRPRDRGPQGEGPASPFLDPRQRRAAVARRASPRFGVRSRRARSGARRATPSAASASAAPASSSRSATLSGGNQQKVVIGKWLATRPARAAARRADARHRRRRQAGDLRPDLPPGRRGARHRAGQLGAARAAAPRRPHPGHVARAGRPAFSTAPRRARRRSCTSPRRARRRAMVAA